MVDHGEGPLFFCLDLLPDEMTLPELERRAELRRQEEVAEIIERWELADPRDRWRHTGEPRPEASNIPTPAKPAYRTPQSVVDAFFFVAGLGDADYLSQWFAQHPLDAPFLCELWERKNAQS